MRLPELPDHVRPAIPDDVEDVLALIRELAEYEREPDAVEATEADLRTAMFGKRPHAGCLIAEVDGATAGFALWYPTFSTWTGKRGIHLEDLYVRPDHRGQGLGRQLLSALARIADVNGWARVEWEVLDWNSSAISFYESIGARSRSDWTTYRLDGEDLSTLAKG